MDPTSGDDEEGETFIKDNHFYIFVDKSHDILFVQPCLLQHWNWLTNHGVTPQHIIFSDGCVDQFNGS